MTPALDIENISNKPDGYHQPPFKHHHHNDTAELLAQAKEIQKIKSLEIMKARDELLHRNDSDEEGAKVEGSTPDLRSAFVADGDNVVGQEAADHDPCGPFEGPEKLLELWFAEDQRAVEQCCWQDDDHPTRQLPGAVGLRTVPKIIWEGMLDIVKCKVLSVVEGKDVDAYLLSESSMFVFPHKLILKTCGTTTLLLGLERLLQIASKALVGLNLESSIKISEIHSDSATAVSSDDASLCDSTMSYERNLGSGVVRAFYSRKSFMFPERQKGPHRDWMLEVAVLDRFFKDGAAYTVGKMNGDHWLLWMGSEEPKDDIAEAASGPALALERPLCLPDPCSSAAAQDQTLEILMTHLSPESCARFDFPTELPHPTVGECYSVLPSGQSNEDPCPLDKGHALGLALSKTLGLSTLFDNTELDAFAFEPCGYSANAVVPQSAGGNSAGYWTIHVTPEEGSSYASFETNIALGCGSRSSHTRASDDVASAPRDLPSLIKRIVQTFEPGKMSVTVFMSSKQGEEEEEEGSGDSALLHKLQIPGYKRTDRIVYEFEGYDLVFVSFEKSRRMVCKELGVGQGRM
ncbi:S-adenosylmethionine decarboxylase [Violaceomyces palustris]|uniref:S-adenosylmethionine decarboxylase n=1 Tax=Violaceomyces palustris TaxID=1673888 RepID=A0ACD0NNE4_9BASI|nr:S-adenosylmethionine decarboxylase [Violaceomyces palustris]